jgi:pimeloyl-ACP methyl ester carboxylesterase
MTVLAADTTAPVEVSGVAIEMTTRGQGRPLVFLHPGHPSGRLDSAAAVFSLLARNARVLAPTHPGFGATPAPRELTTIDDLAYLYLDLFEALDLNDVVLVGAQLGGFIAAQIAVKSTARISHLVLADAFGIKVSDRETRDIADIYAITDKHLAELAWAEPRTVTRDTKTLPEAELVLMARSRESTGRYAWSPFMHDPKLRQRLHRVRVPTLVLWGAADMVARPDYGRAYAAAIPGAKFQLIEGAGSFPHLEAPQAFAQAIADFIR